MTLLNGIAALTLALSGASWAASADHAGHQDHSKHGDHAQHAPAKAAEAPAPGQGIVPMPATARKRDPAAYFTDRQLVDHNGQRMRFYSDVLKGRLVVMNTMFTNCTDACPLIAEQMNKVRAALGPNFGKDVYFVSISSDPERDSPAAMKKFAQKNKADVPGWFWLTGKKEDIDHILKKLGAWSQHVESHATHLIAWNFNNDRGRKMLPNLPPDTLALQIRMLLENETLLPGLGDAATKAN
jgi:protein SCO1